MKVRIILIVSILLGFVCLLSALMILAAQVVTNPTFDDLGSGWSFHWWNGYQFTDYNGSYEHTIEGGTGAGFIVNDHDPGAGHDPIHFEQPLTITPTESYAGSFWLYDDTDEAFLQVEPYNCTNGPYPVVWAVFPMAMGCNSCDEPPPGVCWDSALDYGIATADFQSVWQSFSLGFSIPGTYTDTEALLCFMAWNDDGVSECGYHAVDDVYIHTGLIVTPTPSGPPPPGCLLENYSFDEGLAGWDVGEWVTENEGWIGLHGCTDELNSYIAQSINLTATGPSEYYELSIISRNFFPVNEGSEPLLRWKFNNQILGDNPAGFQGQETITAEELWQISTWTLLPSNMPALSDTLTIWSARQDLKIDQVCITYHSGPSTVTPACPMAPTYTPEATYTPLPTPTAVNSATATAWAATATAWATQVPYPTQIPPNCEAGGDEPGWDFIWLAGQILMFLAAFFEAIFNLLSIVLQPIFDLIGFIVWLLGAAFGLIATLIDLVGAVLEVLLSLLGLSFDILDIIRSFFVALWSVITSPGIDPGFEIPAYFAWPIAGWNLLIEGTPLEFLAPVAMGIGSLLMIFWTIRQFSGGE